MADFRVEMKSEGVKALLNSAGVRMDLYQRAKRIADAAGDGFIAVIPTGAGRSRARAFVITATFAAQLAEATDRTLTKAIDAGR